VRWLIDSVLVDPRAPDAFFSSYRYYLKDRLNFPGTVSKSGLYDIGTSVAAGVNVDQKLTGQEIRSSQGSPDLSS